ncbi:MAG: peptidoglycan-binding protein, partial [Aeromicrobium sp.]
GTIDYGPCVRFKGSSAERTSTPRATPCARPASTLVRTSRGNAQYGRTGGTVRRAQGLLGVPATSRFDAATWAAVRAYQRAHDLPGTGTLDQPTWASLDRGSVTKRVVSGFSPARAAKQGLAKYSRTRLAKGRAAKAVVLLQTALRLPVADRNGYFGAVTFAAVQKAQRRAGLEPDGVVRAEEWRALRAATR